ncbi:hypothetical protein CsSME_00005948 [Camellia sinensis var. sinensis]
MEVQMAASASCVPCHNFHLHRTQTHSHLHVSVSCPLQKITSQY